MSVKFRLVSVMLLVHTSPWTDDVILTRLVLVTSCSSLSHSIVGNGEPLASQTSCELSLTTLITLTGSVMMLGGTGWANREHTVLATK